MILETKLAAKKNEMKQLELIQKRKDQIIEELEIHSGKGKKVIKEVHVEKVRDNKVDEVMDFIVNQGCRVPIHKISDNYFEFGTRKIYVKEDLRTGDIMARDKGGRYVEVN